MTSEYILIYGIGSLATIAAGVGGMVVGLTANRRIPLWCVYAVLALPLFWLVAQLLKLYAHKDYADFSVSVETVYNISRGYGPWTSLEEGMLPGTGHWFSAHFTPFLYLFAIPFAVLPRPEVLITSQFFLLLSAVFAVYVYAKRELLSRKGALVISAVLVLYPTYQYINLYEFEMLRFSIPVLMLTFYFWESGRLPWYWVFLSIALLIREEVSLTACALGLYIWATGRERRWVGPATVAVSLGYFLTVTQLIMPGFRTSGAGEHVAAYWFAALGKTIPEIVWGMVTKPEVVLSLVLDPLKLANIFMYLLPVLFVPLAAWPVLLIGGANVGLNLLSGAITHTSYFLYYLSPAIAFVFIALVKGVKTAGDRLDEWRRRRGWCGDGRSAALTGVFTAALVANVFFGPSPLSLQFWFQDYKLAPFRTLNFHYTQYLVTEHDRRLSEALAVVPKEATVSAEQHLLPALFDRKGLKVFPDISGIEYVVIDKLRKEKTGIGTVPGSWDGLRQNPQQYYDWVERDPDHWRLALAHDGYFVYKRRATS